MATQICPVVGTTTTALPPGHPTFDEANVQARCPITNAKVEHHGKDVIHNHPSDPQISDAAEARNAQSCPALKAATKEKLVDSVCPVVGPVSAVLPLDHPEVEDGEAGEVCPVTNATLKHHKQKVKIHPQVEKNAPAAKCPVASNALPA